MSNKRLPGKVFSAIAVLVMLFSSILPVVKAQSGDGLQRQFNAESGRLSFIGPESGRTLPASRALGVTILPQDPAMAHAKRFGPEFGLKHPGQELAAIQKNEGRDGKITVKYQQKHEGVPVMAGELIVNTDTDGNLYSINGEISPDLSISTEPSITADQARQTALNAIAKWYGKSLEDFTATTAELWIYDESLLKASTRPVEITWRMEVAAKDGVLPVRELVLVDAQRGSLSLHFNQIDTASTSAQQFRTYTANHGSSLPGFLLCTESTTDCTSGSDLHADMAHLFAQGTYTFYLTKHSRNSIDNNGMPILSTVHYKSGYANAFWNGSQMVYGDAYGYPLADDIVGHELTHGVTEYESNLFYFYQSGAIGESFSDLWGEYYDQVGNPTSGDTDDVKWLIGEDVSGLGAMRSMSNPPSFSDPDRVKSIYYYDAPYFSQYWDNGGVHHNSGVNNKAVFLMVDGGSFNTQTVTPLGWDKVAAIYYEANTNLLTSGADYSDLYYALQQACTSLIGQKNITINDCTQVNNALDAVEMNLQHVTGYNPDAPVCDAGRDPAIVFADDFENGTGNWTFTNDPYSHWQWDSPYGQYAQSGQHSLYANDFPDVVTDASAQLKPIAIPANAYLHFYHAYEFQYGAAYYDGGVLEYSTDGGSTWTDTYWLLEGRRYSAVLNSPSNPLGIRWAFAGTSHGYVSTRLNLSSLAGQTVIFRWRLGLDHDISFMGWWVDNVKVYTCVSPIISGNAGAPGVVLSYTDGTAKSTTSGNDGSYSIQVSKNWSGTISPSHPCYTFDPPSHGYNNVTGDLTGQNFTAIFNNAPECGVTVGVFRPSNGLIYLKNSNLTGYADVAINYGVGGDYPIAGDWDGDGVDTIGVFRGNTFYLRNENTVGYADVWFNFGMPGDQPIAGDWNGDGIDTIGVYRSSTFTFYLRDDNSTGDANYVFQLGIPGDIGIAGDWTGKGSDTVGVFRPTNGYVYLKNTNETGYADIAFNYGMSGDKPVSGDWDNDGVDTIGILRQWPGSVFYLRNSNTAGYADIEFALGLPIDMPIAGNWDGNP